MQQVIAPGGSQHLLGSGTNSILELLNELGVSKLCHRLTSPTFYRRHSRTTSRHNAFVSFFVNIISERTPYSSAFEKRFRSLSLHGVSQRIFRCTVYRIFVGTDITLQKEAYFSAQAILPPSGNLGHVVPIGIERTVAGSERNYSTV